jgi:hypothetical protein
MTAMRTRIGAGLMALGVAVAITPHPAHAGSILTEWLDEAVPIANEVAGEPTISARFFAILQTAIYDSWTVYEPVALGVVCGTALKGQGGPTSEANKREAISHAAYTVLRMLAPHRTRALDAYMRTLGYDPQATTPAALAGRRAALAVLAYRRYDGANEAGNFADTTGYQPRSRAAPAAWQPIMALGQRQIAITPHWSRVMPFALARADVFRPPPPPPPGSDAWAGQIDLVLKTSFALTDAQKAAAEFWTDWHSAPPQDLIEMTKFVSLSHDLRLDDDVKLFFVVANTLLDASIAAWDAKYAYDYARPITAIHALGDRPVAAWRPRTVAAALAYSTPGDFYAAAGLGNLAAGPAQLRASAWQPYLPTPAFPSYVSGHSVFAAAWARAMELETGGPDFGFREKISRLDVEQRQLSPPVMLDYPTFQSAAEASGMSRIYAGIHWPADNDRGRELGRKVGEAVWDRAEQFLIGTAAPPAAALATLRAPYWFHEGTNTGDRFDTIGGLGMDLPAGATGVWRSVVLDPLPAGNYEIALSVAPSIGAKIRFELGVEPAGANDAGEKPLAAASAELSGNAANRVTATWISDGHEAFAIRLCGIAVAGGARLSVSALDVQRHWPVVTGSPRYLEPRLAGEVTADVR